MSAFDKAPEYPKIATQAELDQRRAERATPSNDYHMTPHGWETHALKTQTAQANEQRITFLERRLERASTRVETDHSFARLHGHARADFGRGD